MNSIDSSWFTHFNIVKEYAESKGEMPGRWYKTQKLAIGRWIDYQKKNKAKISQEKIELLEQIDLWDWSWCSIPWFVRYKKIKEHIEKFKNYPKKAADVRWLYKNKIYKKAGKLIPRRIALLERLPNWNWEISYTLEWRKKFDILKDYLEKKNYAYPGVLIKHNGVAIGEWLKAQRWRKRCGTLLKDREEMLNSLRGFEWEPKKVIEPIFLYNHKRWEAMYGLVMEYINKYGVVPIKTAKHPGASKLARWIIDQKKNVAILSKDRVEKLNEILADEHTSRFVKWNEDYALLKEFIELFNCLPGTKNRMFKGLDLLLWKKRHEYQHEIGILSEYRIKKLEELPHWRWSINCKTRWDDAYDELKQYIVVNKRFPSVNDDHTTKLGVRLSMWIGRQKVAEQNGKLSIEHKRRLEEIKNWKWSCPRNKIKI